MCLLVQDLGICIVSFFTPGFYFSIDWHGRDTGIFKSTPVGSSCGGQARSVDSGSRSLFGGHRCHGRSPCVGQYGKTLLALPDLFVLLQSLEQ